VSTKIDLRLVIVIIVALFLLDRFILNPGSDDPVVDVSIVADEKVGEVEKELDSIKTDTIYITKIIPGNPLPIKKEIVVDSTYKAQYEQALKENDSLKAKNLFLESISIDTYAGTLIDNEDIIINGEFTTRGKLLKYDLDYTIKRDTITYTPEVVTRFPKFSLVGGVELGLPAKNGYTDSSPVISGHLGFRGKKGNTFSIGFDSEQRVTFGYEWTILKSKR